MAGRGPNDRDRGARVLDGGGLSNRDSDDGGTSLIDTGGIDTGPIDPGAGAIGAGLIDGDFAIAARSTTSRAPFTWAYAGTEAESSGCSFMRS